MRATSSASTPEAGVMKSLDFTSPCIVGGTTASFHRESFSNAYQAFADRGIGRMPGIVHDYQFGARPDPVQLPCIGDRRLKVEAAVHEYAR